MVQNKADAECKRILQMILDEGCQDSNPRPHWNDGAPAHTISINGVMSRYDIAAGESPLLTLRPVAVKAAIGEICWIYIDQSNDLDLLNNKYHIRYWDSWMIPSNNGSRTIGACYGETVRRHHLIEDLINGLKSDPDGRRHIINLYQVEDFKEPHGLKPCIFLSNYNVRHGKDGIEYLDLTLYQRSADFLTAAITINITQYYAMQCMLAHCLGYTPGILCWCCANVQIYDRHIPIAEEMLNRDPIPCSPYFEINPDKHDFFDLTPDDVNLVGYPRDEIKVKNPQFIIPVAV